MKRKIHHGESPSGEQQNKRPESQPKTEHLPENSKPFPKLEGRADGSSTMNYQIDGGWEGWLFKMRSRKSRKGRLSLR